MALARGGQNGVSLGDLAQERDVRPNVYNSPMRALLEARLAERLPDVPGERRRHFRAVGDSALWHSLGELVERMSGYGSLEGMADD